MPDYMHIISMHKFTRDFSISKQNKVRVFWSVIFLSTTFHNREKNPVTNPDGSNEIVSMSVHIAETSRHFQIAGRES